MTVTRKTEIGPVDGTPVKRMFLSIISDYDLKTGLCELVDNAIDLWTLDKRLQPLVVTITLDAARQLIAVEDDAGGIPLDELRLLIAPGGTRNTPDAELIGTFGVGGKRASVALGEHVEIRTRHKREPTHELDITKEWLANDDWEMPVYQIPNIGSGTTNVEISQLRTPFGATDVEEIRQHLGETYAGFLKQGCTIALNGDAIRPTAFNNWAFPEGYSPRTANFPVTIGNEAIQVEITAGLITDRDPEAENYGVYVYCNHRLVVKELRTRDVGYYITSEAGVPHPDASLCRAIVQLQGLPKLMPWNSSKSGINTNHLVFQAVRPTLIQLVGHFSKLSRRLKNEWDDTVTPHTSGTIETITPAEVSAGKRLHLPELPHVRKHQIEDLKALNKKTLNDAPWTVGLVEAIAAVDVIRRQRLDTKNRIALILLDSDFEIGFKEFIVHREDLFPKAQYNDAKIAQLFKHRPDVINDVNRKITIPPKLITKANHYYALRNKLIHERATVGITDNDVENYRSTIQAVLRILFKLRFPK